MRKILLTNNSKLLNWDGINFYKIYTDSPYLMEKNKNAIYLDQLLDNNFDEEIKNIRTKGYEINKQIIKKFFPNYIDRNINIINVNIQFTNIFIKIIKIFKLINLYPNDEIIIGITEDELYNSHPEALNRFTNYYYWISSFLNIKNIKLICKKKKV